MFKYTAVIMSLWLTMVVGWNQFDTRQAKQINIADADISSDVSEGSSIHANGNALIRLADVGEDSQAVREVSHIIEIEEPEAPMALVVAPQANSIHLIWNAIEEAESYRVYRRHQDQQEEAVSGGQIVETAFTFNTEGAETYEVWIEALDGKGDVVTQSQKVAVSSIASANHNFNL